MDVEDIYTQTLMRFDKPSIITGKIHGLELSRPALQELKDRVKKGRVYCEYGVVAASHLPPNQAMKRLSEVAQERICAKIIDIRVLANGALAGQFAFAGPYREEAFESIRKGDAYFSARSFIRHGHFDGSKVAIERLITFDLTTVAKTLHGDVCMHLEPIPSFRVAGKVVPLTETEAILLYGVLTNDALKGMPLVERLSVLAYGHPDVSSSVILTLLRRVRRKLRGAGSAYRLQLNAGYDFSFVRG